MQLYAKAESGIARRSPVASDFIKDGGGSGGGTLPWMARKTRTRPKRR